MKLRLAPNGIDLISRTAAPFETTEVFVQGCNVQPKCQGCWNSSLWSFDAPAREMDPEELARILIERAPKPRVTFCGGEPFAQALPLAVTARALKAHNFFVMSYSGWTYEELTEGRAGGIVPWEAIALMDNLDVLVDGRYDASLRNPRIGEDFEWVGSTNQRIIHMPTTLRTGKPYVLTVPQVCALADGRFQVDPSSIIDRC